MTIVIHNKKANFNYEILERFLAGLELTGNEVKSLRSGQASLDGSYVIIRGAEAWLIGMTIPPYQINNIKDKESDPQRNRKLLLTRDEIARLAGLKAGLTIVPITVYNKGRWFKAEIAIVRGKKKFDKRETIKKRDIDREIRREHTDR